MASVVETVPVSDEELVPKQKLTLYTDSEYFQALTGDVSALRAGDRLAIMTMSFEPSEPLVNDLFKAVLEAADRGAEVLFAVDAYTLMRGGSKSPGPLWLPMPCGQANYKQRLNTLKGLDQKPTATYSIINKPNRLLSNPYTGRSHLKTTVVNNKVYVAGLNLHQSTRADMVVGLEDAATADWLYEISEQIVKSESTTTVLGNEDQSYQIDNVTKILVDAGVPDQSLIFDEALRLIAEADKSALASFQYFPGWRTAREMIAARNRGVQVAPLHNHPSKYPLAHGAIERLMWIYARHSFPKEFFKAQLPQSARTLHSKAIATEKAAIVGSHNYADIGVKFGTAEVAVLREDPVFARAVGNLLMQQACYVENI